MTRRWRIELSGILAVAALALVVSRVFQASTATYGANDRSRWATVRALVDEGTYAIGRRSPQADGGYRDSGIVTEKGWGTIDRVLRPDTQEFLSSKPPLLSTLVAGVYWLLATLFGWSIASDPWRVTRCVLLIVQVLPLAAYLYVLRAVLARYSRTSWGALYVMAIACFATYVTTFSITLNNHTVAASSALFALVPVLPLWDETGARSEGMRFAAAGFFAGFTACMELPAASFTTGLGLVLGRQDLRRTLVIYTPAALVPIAALLATNYLALGQFELAYAKFGSDWYEFEGAAWKNGLGPGLEGASLHETKLEYAFHLVEGHHGLFSLTPVFLLAFMPLVAPARSASTPGSRPLLPAADLQRLAGGALLLTLLLLGFYVVKTSNYGGNTCGPRWFLWLTPFYLIATIPAADRLAASARGRALGYALLAVSVFSANYRSANPWAHPWIYDVLNAAGGLPY